MRDYYRDGFDTGYGRTSTNYENDYPRNDGDAYSYRQGIEEGTYRRRLSEELDREGY
jgi:hypothetical protein